MDNLENDIIIAGHGGGGKSRSRTPKEAAEGILTGSSDNTGLVLSKTQIKVIDLLSEGIIKGFVSGEYITSGTIGNIGWDSVSFNPYKAAIGSNNIRWLQSVFWNDTPVVDKDGKFNFQQTAINYSKGSPNGSNISDDILDELTSTRVISERLRGGGETFAKTYRIIQKNCIGSNVNIRINQLSKTSTDSKTLGDLLIASIEYTIYYRPIFTNRPSGDFLLGKKETIRGKVSAGYIRSTRINFNNDYSNEDNFLGWEIKIVRWTEDSTTSTLRDQSFVDSLTEIYGSKFIYPHSAIVSSLFDAEYFSNIPSRVYETELLKVKIPNNYDPIRKHYDESSPWDGTFKVDDQSRIQPEWTDNPAWCYYDLLTNKRYGLGNYIDEDFVDKFTLYEIGKYCDTIVSDGYGGLEPRFTCNAYVNSQEEAYKVVNSFASIFRGITYYSAGQIYTAHDTEKPTVYQFTNASVVDGNFTYSSSAKKARHTTAIVRYNDKKNYYKPAIEYVEDIDSIRRYGIREVEIPAFGCTSRGQAIRLGRWALLTENLETESVNFKAGISVAGFLRPGDVFQIYDNNKKANRLGGRISNIVATNTSTDIVLDSEITGLNSNTTYKLSLLTPTFYYDTSLVSGITSEDIPNLRRPQIQSFTFNTTNTSISGNKTRIISNSILDATGYHVSGKNIWLIEATGDNVFGDIGADEWETYRVINIKESEEHIYEIQGLQYNIDKFKQIESGFSFTDAPVDNNIVFASPNNLQLTSSGISAHAKIINYKFSITDNLNIQNYRVLTKTSPFLTNDEYSGEYLVASLPNNVYSGYYIPSQNAVYYFRVYSVAHNGLLSSAYAENNIFIDNINPIQDITISSLQISDENLIYNSPGVISSGIYSSDSPTYSWQVGINNITNIPSDISYRISIRSPSINNIPSQEIYYVTTGYTDINPSYTFTFNNNYNSISNFNNRGPFREYDIVVEAMTSGGFSSAGGNFISNGDSFYNNPNGYDILYANNPQPLSIQLYTGSSNTVFYQTGKATQQWITQDGEIKIFFSNSGQIVPLSGFFGDDIAGGTLYYSDSPFTIEEAQNKVPLNPPSKTINTTDISSDTNPIIVPLGLYNKNSQYIAIAGYDSFDTAFNDYNNNYLVTGIKSSNVVKIQKASSSQTYKAWVEFDIGWQNNQWGLINNWSSKAFNIDNIQNVIIDTDFFGRNINAGKITFSEPMPNTDYAIETSVYEYSPYYITLTFRNLGQGDLFALMPFNTLPIWQKNEDSIVIPPFDIMFSHIREADSVLGKGSPRDLVTGRCFIGVLQAS